MSGIYQYIKDTIYRRKQDGKWIQIKKENADPNLHEEILDFEINPILWFSVAFGSNINNEFLKIYNDRYNSPMNFGDSNSYDFYGIGWGLGGSPNFDVDEDVKWLLNGNNNVFSWQNFNFNNSAVKSSIWGRSSIPVYIPGVARVGILENIMEKSYAKEVLPDGIVEDRDLILNLIKEVELLRKNDPNGADAWLTTWDPTIDIIKKNLIKAVKDVGELYDNNMSPMVPKEIYSLSVFYKKVSIATSLFLDGGVFSPDKFEDQKPGVYLQLDEGDMKVKDYSSSEFDEKTIIGAYCTNKIKLDLDDIGGVDLGGQTEKLLTTMVEVGDYLFPTHWGLPSPGNDFINTDNKWLKEPSVPFEEGDEKFKMSGAVLDEEDEAIIGFLKGEKKWRAYEVDTVIVSEANAGNLKVSNRRANGSPKNIEEYDVNKSLWDSYHRENVLLEDMVLDKYIEFALAIELNNLVSTTNNGQDIYSLTKTIDNFAFEIAETIAKIIATNKVNLIKATLFVSLNNIADTPNNDALDGALNSVANAINQGAQLEYEEDELSKTELSERQKLLEQCALLLNLDTLDQKYNNHNKQHLYKDGIHSSGYFGNRFMRINAQDQSRTITYLHSHRDRMEEFLLMNPAIQALLVPKIRIQKIVTVGSVTDTVEIPFNLITSNGENNPIDYQETIGNNSNIFRGGAVGIKNMTFDFDGETPATAQKYVKSTLSIKIQDFRDLVTERNTIKYSSDNPNVKVPTTFRYIDLIVNSGRADVATTSNPCSDDNGTDASVDSIFREHYTPVDYRIKVDVGWNYTKNQNTISLIESVIEKFDDGTQHPINAEDFFDAVDRQNKTFILAALDHDLSINDDGAVDLSINYFGFSDALLSSYKFNALVTSKTEIGVRKELQDLLCQVSAGQCSKTQLAKLQGAIEEKRQQIIKQSMSDIMSRMASNKLIRKIAITDPEQLSTFKKTGAFSSIPKISTSLDPGYQNKLADQPKGFFFLGDLLYTLMDCMYDRSNKLVDGAENITFLLTDFEYSQYLGNDETSDSQNSNIVKINLASIPISVDFFKEWFTDEIIASEKYNYPLMNFVLVLCNKLLGDILTEVCFNKKYDKTLFFRQSTMHSSKRTRERMERITNGTSAESWVEAAKALNQEIGLENNRQLAPYGILRTRALDVYNLLPFHIEPEDLDDVSNINTYVAIYCDMKSETHGGRGNYKEDLDNGIYHFHIGENRGLLKKIKFNKTNIVGLRESRMYRYQGIADFAQLSNVYNVSLDLFGNFLFFPGMQIFIDPFGLGGVNFGRPAEPLMSITTSDINYARLMGVGGYHLIKNVKISIGVGGFTTKVDAIFVFSGDVNGNDEGLNGILNIDPTVSRIENQLKTDETDTAACQTIIDTYETNLGN